MKENKYSVIILVLIIVIIACAFILTSPFSRKPDQMTLNILCTSNLKSIGLALKQYSMDNEDHFPDKDGVEGLEMLRSNFYLADYKIYACPNQRIRLPRRYSGPLEEKYVGYVFRGGLTENDSADSAIAWDKPGNHKDYGNILFIDGHVKGFHGHDWMKNCK